MRWDGLSRCNERIVQLPTNLVCSMQSAILRCCAGLPYSVEFVQGYTGIKSPAELVFVMIAAPAIVPSAVSAWRGQCRHPA